VRIGILTNDVPPFHCGIGNHSINLANAIRLAGEDAVIIASRGNTSDYIHVVECDWSHQGLKKYYQKLESLDLDHLILQFTPLMYTNENHNNKDITSFWKRCSQRWCTSIIVHETYFRTWWYPPSWLSGLREKQLLIEMVSNSHYVFSASQPLVSEMKGWGNNRNLQLLPIGSNFPTAKQDRAIIRTERGIGADEIVLTIFGGGNTLKWLSGHVDATDKLLRANSMGVRWLLLGGVPADWFHLNSEVITLGRISESSVSEWLQASDIFLMPHYAGLCGKRGTLIAAMQHSLPVVGTRTAMTDEYWREVDGVKLIPIHNRNAFALNVLELARSQTLRNKYGKYNRAYFEKFFLWEKIVKIFLKTVQ